MTVEGGDSGGDSYLQLKPAFWGKRDRHSDRDSLANVEIQVEIHVCSRKLHFGAKETEMEIHHQMWRLRRRFMSAAGNLFLE